TNPVDPANPTPEEDADSPTGPTLEPGTPVTWSYLVSNPGNVPLSITEIVDDAGTPGDTGDDLTPAPVEVGGFNVGDTNMDGLLDLDETWQFTADGVAASGPFTNTGSITVTDPGTGTSISDGDPTNHLGESLGPSVGPDLVIGLDKVMAPTTILPGDLAKVAATVTNVGNAAATGVVTVDFVLSEDLVADDSDPLLTRVAETVDLGIGDTAMFMDWFVRFTDLVLPALYNVLAVVKTGADIVETDVNNNTAVDGLERQLVWRFGRFGGRRSTKLHVQGVEYAHIGVGFSEIVSIDPDGRVSLRSEGTSRRSSVYVRPRRGVESLIGSVEVNGGLNNLDLSRSQLAGDVTLQQTLRNAKLGDVTGPSTLSLLNLDGDTRTKLRVKARDVRDLDVTAGHVRSISVRSWSSGDGTDDEVAVTRLDRFRARADVNGLRVEATDLVGRFQAASVRDVDLSADRIRSVSVTTWASTDGRQDRIDVAVLDRFRSKGAAAGLDVTAAERIGRFDALAMVRSNLFAGVRTGQTGLPAATGDFANLSGSIGAVNVRGFRRSADPAFIDARIAGWTIGPVKLPIVDANNGGATFGVAASSIRRLRLPEGNISLPAAPGLPVVHDDFRVEII
ncbi:MAG: hypothetical protein CMJ18_06495, partial [Phycisphaeraceae bacterium]|nr:hypothetical protein [Phycisphaeraceae bacterium]